MAPRFHGRRVLVTGAASGIGRAVALRLAEEGATLVLADRDRAGMEQTARGLDAELLEFDAGRPGSAAEMTRRAAEGGLDAVAVIAGIYDRHHLEDITREVWDRILTVNLSGSFEICQAARPALAASGGAIVTTSSTAGARGIAKAVPYSAAKAGVIGLTLALASELAPEGVRVNCVAPGRTRTALSRSIRPLSGADAVQGRHNARLRGFEDGAEPGAIAAVYAFLASEDARYMTGEVLTVDGGSGIG